MYFNSRSCQVILLLSLLCLPSGAFAQVIWDGDDLVNAQSWNVAGNWSTNAIPSSTSEVIVGAPAPAVIDQGNASVLTLETTAAGAVEIIGARTLTFFGDSLVNDGVITVNSDNSASIATLNLGSQGVEIEGSGEIVLAAPGSLANLANHAQPFIHGADHSIRGEGQIAAQMINNGVITAEEVNGDATAELILSSGAKTNNGIIQSSPTSTLRSNVSITQGAHGRLIADTSSVFINNITIAGGKLESLNGGVFRTSFNALTFDAVDELNGQINLVSGPGFGTGNLVVRGGGFSNNGVILVNQDNAGASGLRFGESGTIDGTGEIILNSPGTGAQISSDLADAVGTLGPNQTVRGVGIIFAELVNNGIIIAEPRSGGSTLEFRDLFNPKTNNNLIRADAGSTINVTSTAINQDDVNGRIFANGGTVELGGNSLIKGGRLEAAGAGKFVVLGNPGQFQDVVSNAPIEVQAGANNMSLLGSSFVNNSTISVGSNLRVDGDVTISGVGEVRLGVQATTSITVSSGFTATNAADHTVRGLSGQVSRILGPGTFVNEGLIEGASPTQPVEINTRLEGSGTLKNVRTNTIHAPGIGAGHAAQVELEGQYTVTNFGAQLEMEIGGTGPGSEYDRLFSSDAANVITFAPSNTQMNVSFINGFFPSHGDVFTLVETAGTIAGNLSAINMPILPGGFAWEDLSTSSTIAYRFTAPLSADFDEDDDVDGNDFLVWQRGGSTNPLSDADLDDWKTQFGSSLALSNAAGSNTAVPEPGGAILMAVSVLSIAHMRRYL
jgi:hypothetical protein